MKPPYTYRGVENPRTPKFPDPEAGLDWLQYSVPWPHGLERWPQDAQAEKQLLSAVLPPHDRLELSGEILRPIQGYNAGMSASFGRIFWHSKNAAQHIGVIFSGDDMRAAIGVMLPHSQMLAWALAKAKTIARLDFALDVFDPRAEPRDLLHEWKRGDMATHAQTIMEQTRYVNDRVRGVVAIPTVYVGRRDSDQMLRCYDKAGEMGQSRHWVRIELQTRHDRALAVAKSMQGQGIPAAGRQAIRNFAKAPKLEWFTGALDGPVVGMAPMLKAETNRDRWLRMVALPALRETATKYARDGDWTLYDALERTLGDILKAVEPSGKRNAHK